MMLAGLVAQRRLAPGGHRAGTAHRAFALAAAVGVVVGVHDRAAHGGPPAHMALAAGLAYLHVLVVDVADLADRGHAAVGNVPKLPGGQPQERHAVLLCHQLGHNARRPGYLRPLAGVQLHVVDKGAGGNVLEGKGVAGLDVGLGPGDYLVPHLDAVGSYYIALLPVLILYKGDKRRAVGVVLNGLHHGSHVVFLALEINDAVLLAVRSAPMAHGNPAVAVTAGLIAQRGQQALLRAALREDGIVRNGHIPARRGSRLIILYCHVFCSLS